MAPPPAVSSEWIVGRRFGRYELLRKLGEGGMGEVWLARFRGPEGFERNVAVKRVRADGELSESAVEMFVQEARIVASLSHPNIVQLYDFGREEASYYIAMEYLLGATLAEIAEHAETHATPLPPVLIAKLVASAAAGLGHAHRARDEKGRQLRIVHRDVSPRNLFVTTDGGVKVLDFGIAKARQSEAMARTNAGQIRGTVRYMSPEHARGARVDCRTDVFALGVILYELLTGTFTAQVNSRKRLEQLASGSFSALNPAKVKSGVPRALAAIVERATAQDPEKRFANGTELSEALDAYLHAQRVPVTAGQVSALVLKLGPREGIVSDGNTTESALQPVARGTARLAAPAPREPRNALRWTLISAVLVGVLVISIALLTRMRGADGPEPIAPDPGALEVTQRDARVSDGGEESDDTRRAMSALEKQVAASAGQDDGTATGDTHGAEHILVNAGAEQTDPAHEDGNGVADAGAQQTALAHSAGVTVAQLPQKAPTRIRGKAPKQTAAKSETGSGTLTLDTEPWTTVFRDRELLGETPLVRLQLQAGTHTLRLVNRGEKIDREVTVTVLPGKETLKRLTLR